MANCKSGALSPGLGRNRSCRTGGAPLALLEDQRSRWERGERILVETYLADQPGLSTDSEAVLDLIGNEILLRQEYGDPPQLHEYLQRFPHLAQPLRLQYEVEQALAETPPIDPTWILEERSAAQNGSPVPPGLGEFPDYEILGILGRGAMGVVYQARQVSLNRLVALKVILAGCHASPDEAARFRREAEAVAQLDHPNIVKIHEVGAEAGQPFLSLEFVAGGSLADKLAGTPQSARPAAELVEILARAVQAMHDKGIVHRDLKPGNVLLNPDGVPKIADFGLAKLRGAHMTRTWSGVIMGTPSYMAPEQANGNTREIGPAADIYALGAILYEMLTGRPPFRGTTDLETLLHVRSQQPVSVRRLQPTVPRDLETICLKCLEKEPHNRYARAADLAADLHRFLAGEPVQARPLGRLGSALRWVRRRPLEAALAVVCFLGLAALVVIAIQRDVNYRERLASNAIREERRIAHENFDQARRALHEIFVLLSEGELRNQPGLQELRRRLLNYYQQYVEQRCDDPQIQAELADSYVHLAAITGTIGDKSLALDFYQKAQELYRSLSTQQDDPEQEDRLALTSLNRGLLFRDLGELDKAEAEFRAALAALNSVTAHSPHADYRRHLAEVHHSWGVLQRDRQQYREALHRYQQALAIRQQLVKDYYCPEYLRDLARSHGYMGDVYLELGETAQALKSYRESHVLREQLAKDRPDDHEARFQLARSYDNFGTFHARAGDITPAISAYEKARKLQEDNVSGSRAALTEYQDDLAWTCNALAELYLDQDRFAEALADLTRARDLYRSLATGNPRDTSCLSGLGRTQANLGRCYLRMNDPALARGVVHEARSRLAQVATLRTRPDPDDLYSLAMVQALEEALLRQGPKKRTALEQARQRTQAGEARASLHQAVRHGYRDFKHLQRNTCFHSLWSPEELAHLIRELEQEVQASAS